MIAVVVCLLVVSALVALLGAADKRWPDRLSRRGRHLAGLPEGTAEPAARIQPVSRRSKPVLQRGTAKSELYRLAFGTQRAH
jgi:hypothetical protein